MLTWAQYGSARNGCLVVGFTPVYSAGSLKGSLKMLHTVFDEHICLAITCSRKAAEGTRQA
jgi:hypothetical protein